MIHPFFKNKNVFFSFMTVWALIMGVHTVILCVFFDYSISICLFDAFFTSVTYAALSIGLWFPIKYGIHYRRRIAFLILGNIILFLITSSMWFLIFFQLYGLNTSLNELLLQTYPARIIVVLLLYVSTILVYYALNYYHFYIEKQAQELALKNKIKEAQLNELRSQIHPHFLFNSLNSINALILLDAEKASIMLIKLSDFLRYSLSQKGHSLTSLEKELSHTHLYIDIETVRYGARLNFVSHIQEETQACLLPLMLLQPLIENAVKHGVYNSIDTVHIELITEIKNDYLSITIKNNFDKGTHMKSGTGTGLKNVKERLKLVYDNSFSFDVNQTDGVFTVQILIPKVI